MRGAVLTNEAYDEMGGVEGSIATVAEAVYTRLSKGDKERLPKLFIQLVSAGEESEDTRRRATMTTVGEDARPLIDRLATARLPGHQLRREHGDVGSRPRSLDPSLEAIARLGQ